MSGGDRTNLSCVASAAAAFRVDPGNRELEVRAGRWVDGSFVPGVSTSDFELLLDDMAAASLVGDDKWTEFIDYNYTHAGKPVRTRVFFDTEAMTTSTEHCSKRKITSSVLKSANDAGGAFRMCLSEEKAVKLPPCMCMPNFVRIQQRKTFRDVRDGKTVWKYELSKTWSATSRGAVGHVQHTTPPVLEVECELVDEGGGYLAENDNEYVARSLLMKANLLMGESSEDIASFQLVQDTKGKKRARQSGSARKIGATVECQGEPSTETMSIETSP